ncbi:site-2 protease family protein [Proteiniborus sp. DW1]|uniref:site-2 protease family protein n=1 Tax=Proteiniborus sp. DW1 TaxID=1889883 RepID=UPI00325A9FD7
MVYPMGHLRNIGKVILYAVITYFIYYIQVDIHELGHYISARIASLDVAAIYLSFINIHFSKKNTLHRYEFHLPYKEVGGTLKTFSDNNISNKLSLKKYKEKLLMTSYGGPLVSLIITIFMYFCFKISNHVIWIISFIISLLILITSLLGDVLNAFSMNRDMTFFAQMAIMQELMLPKSQINKNNLEYLSTIMADEINFLIKNGSSSIFKKYNISVLILSSLILGKSVLHDNTVDYFKKVILTNAHDSHNTQKNKNQNMFFYFILYMNLIIKDTSMNNSFLEFLNPSLLRKTEINMIEKYIFLKNINDESFFKNCENELSTEKNLYIAIWNTYK